MKGTIENIKFSIFPETKNQSPLRLTVNYATPEGGNFYNNKQVQRPGFSNTNTIKKNLLHLPVSNQVFIPINNFSTTFQSPTNFNNNNYSNNLSYNNSALYPKNSQNLNLIKSLNLPNKSLYYSNKSCNSNNSLAKINSDALSSVSTNYNSCEKSQYKISPAYSYMPCTSKSNNSWNFRMDANFRSSTNLPNFVMNL